MAGRKHHYLPQFIQRPFAYRQQGKEFYVHAHHRTHGRFNPNTNGLGKELDFYGGPDDPTLDAAITQTESGLAATVQAINQGGEVLPADMATLISALAFRTKSMREALVGMFPALLEALRIRLLDPNSLRKDLMESLTDPKKRKQLLYKEIDERMGPLSREQRAKAYGTLLPRWKSLVVEQEERLVAEAWHLAYMVLAKARGEANAIADGAYLQALARDPMMPKRAERMAADMVFEVLDAPPDEFFILGDCGPVALYSDGKPRLVLAALDRGVEIETVFLPVSPTRCIVGRTPTATASLSTMDINHISASLSLEFFVSDRTEGEGLDQLRASIGSFVPFETAEDIVEKLGQERG